MISKRRFNVISNVSEKQAVRTRSARHPIAVAVGVLAAALLVAAAQWTHSGQGSKHRAPSGTQTQSADRHGEFEYLPAKYSSEAKYVDAPAENYGMPEAGEGGAPRNLE